MLMQLPARVTVSSASILSSVGQISIHPETMDLNSVVVSTSSIPSFQTPRRKSYSTTTKDCGIRGYHYHLLQQDNTLHED